MNSLYLPVGLLLFCIGRGTLNAQVSEKPSLISEVLSQGDTGSAMILMAERWQKAEKMERSQIERTFMETIPWMSSKEAFSFLSGKLLDLREVPSKKIFLLLPLKGQLKPLAEAFLRGFRLGISPSIRLEVIDVSSGLKKAKNRIKKGTPALVVGPVTSQSGRAIAPIAAESLVPIILPMAEDIRLQQRPLIFLLEGGLLTEAAVALRFAVDSLGMRKFVSLVPDNALGLSLEKVFRVLAAEEGARVIWSAVYEPDSTDFSSIVERLKILEPEVIFFPYATKYSLILASQIRANGIKSPFLGLHSWGDSEARQWSKRGIDSVFVFTPFINISKIRERSELLVQDRRFKQRYISIYEEDPPPFSKRGYDSANFISKMFQKEGFLSALEAWHSINKKGIFFGISGKYLLSKDLGFIKIYLLRNGRLKKLS